MSGPIPFPEDLLAEIGRINVAASQLEFMLAEFAAEVLDDVSADYLLSGAGRVLSAARKAADSLDEHLASLFVTWVESARELLAERHRIVHSTWFIRPVAPGVGEYFGRHPRTQSELDPNPDHLRQIASLLDDCTSDGFGLIFAHGRMLKPDR
jgi:hypothetical protein